MRATLLSGKPIWLDDESIKAITESESGGSEVLFQETVGTVTEYLVAEDFEALVDQIDPLLEGETVEEVAGSLLKGVASVPLSLIRKVCYGQ